MNDESKYTNPITNPMIKFWPDDLPPVMEEDEPRPSLEEYRVPMKDYRPKQAAAAESSPAKEKPEVEPGDFEEKVKTFMDKADEVIIVAPVGNEALFKISKRQCGTLEVIDADGSRRTLAALDPEERKIVNYNLYSQCASGKGDCPCNQI